jgi:uncharacterized protein (TIGR02611 family)
MDRSGPRGSPHRDEVSVPEKVGAGMGTGACALRIARKAAVLLVGGLVLLAGVVLIVTPGPAFLVIPAGLAILSKEFTWARRLLEYGRERVAAFLARARAATGGVARG